MSRLDRVRRSGEIRLARREADDFDAVGGQFLARWVMAADADMETFFRRSDTADIKMVLR